MFLIKLLDMSKQLESVSTTLSYSESREVSVMAAQFNVTKNAMLRGIIRYALAHKKEMLLWLKTNKWRDY